MARRRRWLVCSIIARKPCSADPGEALRGCSSKDIETRLVYTEGEPRGFLQGNERCRTT